LARSRAIAVGLVEQPYRVAGKRAPVPAPRLDVAFAAVAQAARAQVQAVGRREPVLLVGGRSSGARVACRTAAAIGAQGVLALAFPLSPPRAPGRERPSRLPELLGAGAPVLVVQGERDVFGSADQLRVELDAAKVSGEVSEEVIVSTAVGADHALRKGIDASVITEWLARFLT
jgi:predicted alpha/beta-hydrolase family hydrolase